MYVPNKQPVSRLDYCQYLLSSQINYTLTNFADHSQRFSHDQLNRFLRKEKLKPRLVWEQVKDSISNKFPEESQDEDKNEKIFLASGDGLVYQGRELIHYRYSLPKGHKSTSLFFHYVPKDFVGDLS